MSLISGHVLKFSKSIAIKQVFFCFIDINECALNLDNCHLNATCTNTQGSFSCACRPGFSGDGVSCTGTFKFYIHVNSSYSEVLLL